MLNIRFKLVLFFGLILAPGTFEMHAQNPYVDSLRKRLTQVLHDSEKVKTIAIILDVLPMDELEKHNRVLFELSEKYTKSGSEKERYFYTRFLAIAYCTQGLLLDGAGDTDGAMRAYSKSLPMFLTARDTLNFITTHVNLGFMFQSRGNYLKGLHYYNECENKILVVKRLDSDPAYQRAYAILLNNTGNIYSNIGNPRLALEYYHRSLKIYEKMHGKIDEQFIFIGKAQACTNIGYVFTLVNEDEKSNDYFLKAYQFYLKAGDTSGMAVPLNNMASYYSKIRDTSNSLKLYRKSLELATLTNNNITRANVLNNMGTVYQTVGMLDKALLYLKESLAIRMQIGDRQGEAVSEKSIGWNYFRRKDFTLAKKHALLSFSIGNEIKKITVIGDAAALLKQIYTSIGDYKNALSMSELSVKMTDSVNNERTRKAAIKSQYKYEYEKQASADSVAHAKESEMKNVQLQKQKAEIKAKKNQQYALFGGLGLVIVFAGFMFNRFKVTQKQKYIIEEQKAVVEEQKRLVEEKQKEVMDSIRYAKRIQTALLPNERYIEKSLAKLTNHEGK